MKMFSLRMTKYLMLIIILVVIGFWFIQHTYYSTVNLKLSVRQKLRENIDLEFQSLEIKKDNLHKDIDILIENKKPLKKKKIEERFVEHNHLDKNEEDNVDFRTKQNKEKLPQLDIITNKKIDSLNKKVAIKIIDSNSKKTEKVTDEKKKNPDSVPIVANPESLVSKISSDEKKHQQLDLAINKDSDRLNKIATYIKLKKSEKVSDEKKDNSDSVHVVATPEDLVSKINSAEEAEELYFKTITTDTATCSTIKRFGRSDDGGWDVCLMRKLQLQTGKCMVYSFGVNYIWEFDDELATKYQCTVRTFDPSMTNEPSEYQRPSKVWFYKLGLGIENTIWSNGWKIMTLSSLMKKFHERDQIIDILKIDIEYSEWDSFTAILKDGIFSNVKQLLFETHTEEVQNRATTMENYIRFLKIWNQLSQIGFRQWKHHWNHFGNFQSKSGKQRTCCYEHYLINTNFL